ncbi:hypothetical protein SCOCK_170103 [Actinacidiphila cocklensis]|uniref:Uncharacterized protein n=1 Tax=Actinacidiphila cocklensis TaxID=887465 RepID=A0A9W4DM85_9ACTN|nr:hypothetical protein SCOCK_170103 [Actinacidiphila cocklensis]
MVPPAGAAGVAHRVDLRARLAGAGLRRGHRRARVVREHRPRGAARAAHGLRTAVVGARGAPAVAAGGAAGPAGGRPLTGRRHPQGAGTVPPRLRGSSVTARTPGGRPGDTGVSRPAPSFAV